jgi:hypothetical protein
MFGVRFSMLDVRSVFKQDIEKRQTNIEKKALSNKRQIRLFVYQILINNLLLFLLRHIRRDHIHRLRQTGNHFPVHSSKPHQLPPERYS